MIAWEGEGILLSSRPHGETSAIVEVLTPLQGRHAGVVRGGASRKMAATLQPGGQVAVRWSARLEDHIGVFTIEPVRSRAAILQDRAALAALQAICGLLRDVLPEREAHPALYARTERLLDAMVGGPGWGVRYAYWERDLLAELGFGLDLSACAVTGGAEALAYVSPRTGRAVSVSGAGAWKDRLLPLPAFFTDEKAVPDLAAAFRLTGHFLKTQVAEALDRPRLLDQRAEAVRLILRDQG